MRTWRLGLALAACLSAVACGDGNNDSGGNTGSGGVVTVRSGDRITWDQPVESPDTARAYTYRIYVDGNLASLTEIVCADVRSAGGVTCSGRLPSMSAGRHTLELTAAFGSSESPRSTPMAVSMASLAVVTPSSPDGDAPQDSTSQQGLACVSALPEECYATRVIAAGLGTVTSLVATRDRVFILEGPDRIRVVVKNTLAAEPALVADPGRRLVDIAAPPDFERTRTLYVAWSEPSRNGGEMLQISRYRDVLGSLGEGATIVAGLPLPADGFAPIAIDDRGMIYVALPASAAGTDAAVGDLSHFVLRFNADGTLPPDNPAPSPVIAHGYGRPSALIWNQGSNALWLSGSDDRPRLPISTLRTENATSWPLDPVPFSTAPQELLEASSLTVTQAALGPQLWVVEDGVLHRARLIPGRTLPLDAIVFGGAQAVGRITAGVDGSLVVATKPPTGQSTEVLRLTPVN